MCVSVCVCDMCVCLCVCLGACMHVCACVYVCACIRVFALNFENMCIQRICKHLGSVQVRHSKQPSLLLL